VRSQGGAAADGIRPDDSESSVHLGAVGTPQHFTDKSLARRT
jgi:hypothetical protein